MIVQKTPNSCSNIANQQNSNVVFTNKPVSQSASNFSEIDKEPVNQSTSTSISKSPNSTYTSHSQILQSNGVQIHQSTSVTRSQETTNSVQNTHSTPIYQSTSNASKSENEVHQSIKPQREMYTGSYNTPISQKINLSVVQSTNTSNVKNNTEIANNQTVKVQNFSEDKATYNPGNIAHFNVTISNPLSIKQYGTYRVTAYNPVSQTETIATGNWNALPNGTANINFDWKTPNVDNRGYIINMQLMTTTGKVVGEFDDAIDVDSDPYRHPRYGALTDFSGDDIPNELKSVDSFAKNYHLNMQMLYDCYFRPQNPIPSNMSSWTDWHGDKISKDAIQQIVNRIHQDGSKAWLYDMINAFTGKPGDADADLNGIGASEQNGQVVAQTGLFYPKGSDMAGQQFHVSLGNNPDTDIQWYNDPANAQWQNYYIPKIKEALKEIGFDGWQGDTNGQMIGTTYQNRNTDKTINDADFYYYFVQAVEKAFGNQYGFGLNAVNNVGQDSIATKSKPTIDYTELWPSSFKTYDDIANVIEKNWQNDGKPLVVPAYFMDQWRNDATSGKGDSLPKTYNTNAVRQLVATIMANGGSPMVLSDGGYLLDDEYYLWPRLEKGKQINMSDDLGNPVTGDMRHYWDFDTGYENLLQDPNLKLNNNYIQVWNGNGVDQGQCINKNDAESNTVYAFSKSNGKDLDTLNLINLMGSTNQWQVNNNQDNNEHNIQPQKNLWIKYYPSEQNSDIKHIYVSSPDAYYQGKRIELPFKEMTDPSGHKYVEFEVPNLEVWDLIYMTTQDPETLSNTNNVNTGKNNQNLNHDSQNNDTQTSNTSSNSSKNTSSESNTIVNASLNNKVSLNSNSSAMNKSNNETSQSGVISSSLNKPIKNSADSLDTNNQMDSENKHTSNDYKNRNYQTNNSVKNRHSEGKTSKDLATNNNQGNDKSSNLNAGSLQSSATDLNDSNSSNSSNQDKTNSIQKYHDDFSNNEINEVQVQRKSIDNERFTDYRQNNQEENHHIKLDLLNQNGNKPVNSKLLNTRNSEITLNQENNSLDKSQQKKKVVYSKYDYLHNSNVMPSTNNSRNLLGISLIAMGIAINRLKDAHHEHDEK